MVVLWMIEITGPDLVKPILALRHLAERKSIDEKGMAKAMLWSLAGTAVERVFRTFSLAHRTKAIVGSWAVPKKTWWLSRVLIVGTR